VSCGAVHVVALSEEGLLQAWGNSLIAFIYYRLSKYIIIIYYTCFVNFMSLLALMELESYEFT
jgi:alpha-tubulin suppressor-like RCC1 family protein